jgi:hypothetical protein
MHLGEDRRSGRDGPRGLVSSHASRARRRRSKRPLELSACVGYVVGVLAWGRGAGLDLSGSGDVSARQSRRTLAALTRLGSQTGSQRRQAPGHPRRRAAMVSAGRSLLRPRPATCCDATEVPPKQQAAGSGPARGASQADTFAGVFKAWKPIGEPITSMHAAASRVEISSVLASRALGQRQPEPHELAAMHRRHALSGPASTPRASLSDRSPTRRARLSLGR